MNGQGRPEMQISDEFAAIIDSSDNIKKNIEAFRQGIMFELQKVQTEFNNGDTAGAKLVYDGNHFTPNVFDGFCAELDLVIGRLSEAKSKALQARGDVEDARLGIVKSFAAHERKQKPGAQAGAET